MSATKKHRRRSSLCASKVRIELSPNAAIELHGQTSDTLNKEEKIEQLCKLAIQYALDKQIEDIGSPEVMEYLFRAAPDCQELIETEKFQEAMKKAFQSRCLKPNPVNIQTEMDKHMLKGINKLKCEEQAWKDYIARLTEQASKAERRLENPTIHVSEMTEHQIALSKSYLPCQADLLVVKTQVEDASKKTFIMLHEHKRNVHRLAQAQTKLQKQMDHLANRLYGRDFENIRSPKSSIGRLLEFPSPS